MALHGWGVDAVGWRFPVSLSTTSDLPLTISCWIRVQPGASSTMFAALQNSGGSPGGGIVLKYDGGFLQCWDSDNALSVVHGRRYSWTPDGKWHHLAGRLENLTANGAILYLDGVIRSTSTYGTTMGLATFNQLNVGFVEPAWSPRHIETGSDIAEVAVWRGIVSDSDLKAMASGQSPASLSNQSRLVAYFPLRNSFEEGHQGRRLGLAQYGLLVPAAGGNSFSADFASDFGGASVQSDAVWTDHPPVTPFSKQVASWSLRTSGVTSWTASATLSGAGSLTADAYVQAQASATIVGSGNVTGPARLQAVAGSPISGVGSVSAQASVRVSATATIAAVGSLTAKIDTTFASALISGAGGVTLVHANTRLRAAANAVIAGSGNLAATLRMRALARSVIGGVGNIDVTISQSVYDALPAAITRVGTLLLVEAETSLPIVAESDVLFAPLADRDLLTVVLDNPVTALAADPAGLVLSSIDQAQTMALIHPVSVDPTEQIFLKIDARPLLSPTTELITSATFTPSSQATIDGHSLITSYFDAVNYMLGFKPTGGTAGSQYAWTLVWNTTDIDARTQRRKRTIMVNVATK